MRLWCRLMALLVVGLPLAVAAADTDDALLADYIGLTKLLRASGVDPVQVAWAHIEPMCLGLKTEKDKVAYNRCRFTKALDQATFADDRAGCDEDSRLQYPDGMGIAGTTVVTTSSSAGDTTTVATQPMPLQQLYALRRTSYTACMRNLGWKNTRNWQMGREE